MILTAMTLAGGCAAPQQLSQGDRLLAAGQFGAAVDAFEAALLASPKNRAAEEGIRQAQAGAVRVKLSQAQEALQQDNLPDALRHGLAARGLPLDLDEVQLHASIDGIVERATRRAERQVARWGDKGQFVPAVDLADRVVAASPNMASRQAWRDEVRHAAIRYYTELADDLKGVQLFGSAALQLAMGKHVGADVAGPEVMALWQRFSEPLCFGEPRIVIDDAGGTFAPLVDALHLSLKQASGHLRRHCPAGARDWSLSLVVENAERVDRSQVRRVARPLPGSGIKTVETYIEEVPYTVVQAVTEVEKREQEVERRDCAPRPGKKPGCSTWLEKVQVDVPVTRQVVVRKVRRVKKTRPAAGPFPDAKVVRFRQTEVTRAVRARLRLVVESGAQRREATYERQVQTHDFFHARVEHPRLTIAADPDDSTAMAALQLEFAALLMADAQRTLSAAAQEWSQSTLKAAEQRTLQGQLPKAEELYLGVLALGVPGPAPMRRFFLDRYGVELEAVVDTLAGSLKRSAPSAPPVSSVEVGAEEPTSAPTAEIAPAQPDVSPISAAELAEFEAAVADDSPVVRPDEKKKQLPVP